MPEMRVSLDSDGSRGSLPAACVGQEADVVGLGAAAPSDDVDPTRLYESGEGVGHHLRGLVVLAVLVGQAGVGYAGYREAGQG